MNSKTEIRIIPFGLRQEETLVQIAETMNNLETIVRDVFDSIDRNIRERKTRLIRLKSKSVSLNEKLNSLNARRSVAITLYGDSQFPEQREQGVNDRYERTLELSFVKPSTLLKDTKIRSKFSSSSSIARQKFTNKLQFYHVKKSNRNHNNNNNNNNNNNSSSSNGNEYLNERSNYLDDLLGNLPTDLESVNNLLLFNTAENLYKEYVRTANPLDAFNLTESLLNEMQTSNTIISGTLSIAPAPYSIERSNYVERNLIDDYFSCFYKPEYREIPSLDVPQDLPDLPGIAQETENSILDFSNSSSNNNNKLVRKTDSKIEQPVSNDNNETTQIKTSLNINLSDDVAEKKDLPPTISSPAPPSSTIPPPPPPPPPLPPPVMLSLGEAEKSETTINNTNTSNTSVITNTTSIQSKNNSSADVHNNLMEAIRKAGGKERAKLRPVIRTDQTLSTGITKRATPLKNSSGNEQFMEDLYAKLALRRKGISGPTAAAQTTDIGSSGGSLLNKISAIIPPPSSDDSEPENGDDNEWDDD